FRPDGQVLASGGHDDLVRLWESATPAEWAVLPARAGRVRAVAFAPAGRALAAGCDRGGRGAVRLWGPATGGERAELPEAEPAAAVALSPDGRLLAAGGSDGAVRLWDPAAGRGRGEWKGHAGPVAAVAFSPDGATLASAGDDGTVRLWDVAAGTERAA